MDSKHENSNNHNSEAQVEVVEGSGGSKHPRTSSNVTDGPEEIVLVESGNSPNHSEAYKAGDRNGDSLKIHQTPSSSSSSSSSSSTSSKDLLNVNTDKEINAQPSIEDDSVGPDTMPPTQTPPVQAMDRTSEYDPNRIPSSIFERNTPSEWSCASNESLFSIHIGNNSFSIYRDPTKSEENFRPDELPSSSPCPSVPPSLVAESITRISESDGNAEAEAEVKDEKETDANSGNNAVSWKCPTTTSHGSDRSINSRQSFSFPILAGGVSREQAKSDKKQNTEPQPETNPNPTPDTCCYCLPACPWWCCRHSVSCSCPCS